MIAALTIAAIALLAFDVALAAYAPNVLLGEVVFLVLAGASLWSLAQRGGRAP